MDACYVHALFFSYEIFGQAAQLRTLLQAGLVSAVSVDGWLIASKQLVFPPLSDVKNYYFAPFVSLEYFDPAELKGGENVLSFPLDWGITKASILRSVLPTYHHFLLLHSEKNCRRPSESTIFKICRSVVFDKHNIFWTTNVKLLQVGRKARKKLTWLYSDGPTNGWIYWLNDSLRHN